MSKNRGGESTDSERVLADALSALIGRRDTDAARLLERQRRDLHDPDSVQLLDGVLRQLREHGSEMTTQVVGTTLARVRFVDGVHGGPDDGE